jgi:TolA-binding protein
MRERSYVAFVVFTATVAACAGSGEQQRPVEAPIEPLVIGTSRPPPVAPLPDEPPDVPVASSTSLAIPARDPRLARAPRHRSLVVTELQQLEALFATVSRNAPDRPLLVRRLAEDYAELARATDGTLASSARTKAFEKYELLVSEYPQYPQLDEATYFAGLERELNGDLSGARRDYFQLISRSPKSKLVPLAYFAFGEMFYVEGANDPSKDDLALQAFMEVLKFPPPNNTVYPDALLRLGQLHERKGDTARANAMYGKLRQGFPTSAAAAQVGKPLLVRPNP